jgi:hypothetical protein
MPLPSALFVQRLIHSDFRILAGTGGKGLKVFDLTAYWHVAFNPKLWRYKKLTKGLNRVKR